MNSQLMGTGNPQRPDVVDVAGVIAKAREIEVRSLGSVVSEYALTAERLVTQARSPECGGKQRVELLNAASRALCSARVYAEQAAETARQCLPDPWEAV